MEKLTPDAKYLLAEKLSGVELVKLCATDVNMRQICSNSRYNSIWIKRLKDDFNVDYNGNNAYMEYLQNTYFYKQEYWTVIHQDMNTYDITDVTNYKSRDDAIDAIVNYIQEVIRTRVIIPVNENEEDTKNWGYPVIKRELDVNGEIDFMIEKIILTNSSFDTKPRHNYKERYEQRLRALSEMVHTSKQDQDDFIDDFKTIVDDWVDIGEDKQFDYEEFEPGLMTILPKGLSENKLREINNYVKNLLTSF